MTQLVERKTGDRGVKTGDRGVASLILTSVGVTVLCP